jgi:hypothetical protein
MVTFIMTQGSLQNGPMAVMERNWNLQARAPEGQLPETA